MKTLRNVGPKKGKENMIGNGPTPLTTGRERKRNGTWPLKKFVGPSKEKSPVPGTRANQRPGKTSKRGKKERHVGDPRMKTASIIEIQTIVNGEKKEVAEPFHLVTVQ